ncbi:Acg family FMN-binding oxidoreductase [Actinomadura rugatobispora]|uniref:Acg family FMN-binding oxidoreductase n=1 Tax=Actinomadura rugatobispora TaxID=1994 RepID=A0ABW1A8U2_9ACTN|nr:nitroreductase family protein [Actinomadura rugatobispora]
MGTADVGREAAEETARIVRKAVEAAVWAPSVHNTQPWTFGVRGSRVSVRADDDRRLGAADPRGREMLISCGAALCTLRIAIRALGREAETDVLPDPDRPHLLADVRLGTRTPGDEQDLRLYAAVHRRRAHRGAFRGAGAPPSLLPALKREVEQEGAQLIQAVETHTQEALAGLTRVAEHVQRLDPAHAGEAARWAPVPGSGRRDGVHESAYPAGSPRTEPDFPGRDFARGHGWGAQDIADEVQEVHETGGTRPGTGVILLITTPGDTPRDWIRAGQALQRMLLRAASDEGLAAAFHTQALEIPELRDFIRARFCNGRYPQMLLRLGVPLGPELDSVRRPADAVISEEF